MGPDPCHRSETGVFSIMINALQTLRAELVCRWRQSRQQIAVETHAVLPADHRKRPCDGSWHGDCLVHSKTADRRHGRTPRWQDAQTFPSAHSGEAPRTAPLHYPRRPRPARSPHQDPGPGRAAGSVAFLETFLKSLSDPINLSTVTLYSATRGQSASNARK